MRIGWYILILLFYNMYGFSQVSQKGIVTEISSGNKPISGTSIIITNAPPTDSDLNGHFRLNFQHAFPGDPLLVQEIHKKGYEVVNEDEINNWVLTDKESFNIVLARTGYVDSAKRKYYRIGTTAYQRKYQEVLDKLNKEKASQQLSEQIYRQKVDSLNQELHSYNQKLKIYVDKFARINKDRLDETEKRALSLIEEGKLEEAIQVYEDMHLLQRMEEHHEIQATAMKNLETLEQSLCNELQLLQDNNLERNHDRRIDSIYHVLIDSFPTTLSYQYAYAQRAFHLGRYDEVLNIYNSLLNILITSGNQEEVLSLRQRIEQLKDIPALAENPKIQSLEKKINDALRIIKYKTFN